jgi:hypothetical protein
VTNTPAMRVIPFDGGVSPKLSVSRHIITIIIITIIIIIIITIISISVK